MKSLSIHLCLAAIVALGIVGCGPKPVVDDGTGRPAADVTVTTETASPQRNTEPEATGVDVQVGGGQGVQVEVDREPNSANE